MVLQRNRRRQRKKKAPGGGGAPAGVVAAVATAGRDESASEESGGGVSSGEEGPRAEGVSQVRGGIHDEDPSFFSPISTAVHPPVGGCQPRGGMELLGKPRSSLGTRQIRQMQMRSSDDSCEKRDYRSSGAEIESDGAGERGPEDEHGGTECSVTESDEQYSNSGQDEEEDYMSRHRSDAEDVDSYSSEGEDGEGYDDDVGSNRPLDLSGDDEGEEEYEDEEGDSLDDLSPQGASPVAPSKGSSCGSGGASGETGESGTEGGSSAAQGDDTGEAEDDAAKGNMESDMYFTESDDEDAKEYRKGGYHPVKVGEIYNRRYRIEAKLGWGHFSTVWLATDLQSSPLEYVAIKFQKSAKHYTEAAVDEVHLLTAVKEGVKNAIWREASKGYSEIVKERLVEGNAVDTNNSRLPPPPLSPNSSLAPPPVVVFKEKFAHTGPNGRHMCLVFEVLGPNLLSLIKRFNFRGLPMNLVRRVATDVLYGLSYLHDVCDIIHTDLKPENVCVSAYPLPSPLPPAGAGAVPAVSTAGPLTAEDKKRERRKRKKQNRKQRKKALAAALAAAEKEEDGEKGDNAGSVAEGDEDDEAEGAENDTGLPHGREAKEEVHPNADETTSATAAKDAEEKEEKGDSAPPYVKGNLRPSRSDPSLLTSYTDSIHAVQGTLNRHMYNYVGYSQFRSPAAYCCPRSGRRVMYWLPIDYDEKEAAGAGDSGGKKETCEKGEGSKQKGKEAKRPVAPAGDEKAASGKTADGGEQGQLQQLPLLHDDLLLHPVAEGIYAKQQKAATQGCSSGKDAQGAAGGESETNGDVLMWGPYVKLAPGEEPPKEMTVVNTTEGRICIKPLPPSSFVFEQPSAVYKLCDLGNACWVHEHFTDDIQTRQYRSPEVIIRAGYDCSADIWSFACMLFELITGDYLFDPKSSSAFDRDEDHLALIIELLGMFPTDFVSRGRLSGRFFRGNTSQLRRIQQLRFWPLDAVLREKYHLPAIEAESLSDFLLPMLAIDPRHRQSAAQMLQHPWLRMRTMQDEIVYAQMRRNMHVSHPAIDGILQHAPGEEQQEAAPRPRPRGTASASHNTLSASMISSGTVEASQALAAAQQQLAGHHFSYDSLFASGVSPGDATSSADGNLSGTKGTATTASTRSCGGITVPVVSGSSFLTGAAPVGSSHPAYAASALEAAVAGLVSSAPSSSGTSASLGAAASLVSGAGSARLPPHLSPTVALSPHGTAHQPSPVSPCSSLASHSAYPPSGESQARAQPPAVGQSSAAGGRAAGAPETAATGSGAGVGATSFIGNSPLSGSAFHLASQDGPSTHREGKPGAGSLFGQQLPPQDLQQLLLLLPAEKQALLQEHSTVSGAATSRGVETPAAIRGTLSLDAFDQAFLAGRVHPTPTTSSPPRTSYPEARNAGVRLPVSARPSMTEHASAGDISALASARGPTNRRKPDEEQFGSPCSRTASMQRREQLRQQMLDGITSSVLGAERHSLNADEFAALRQQHCTPLPLGAAGNACGNNSGILGSCATDVDFPSDVDFTQAGFPLTRDMAGSDPRGAVHMLLGGTDSRGQHQGGRNTLPSGTASGTFPWQIQNQQQLASAELLAALKQEQRAVSNCFPYAGMGSGPTPGAQVKSGAGGDVKQHIPYGPCKAQQLAQAGGSGVDSFASQHHQVAGGGRDNTFSEATRKADERGWQATPTNSCQQWRPDCSGISFHPYQARHQQLDQLVQQDGVQRQMQHQLHEKDQREKLKQQLLRQQEDLTRLLGKAQQQFQQQQQLQQQ
ncbi:putative cell-cycle-associated protein kinase SRPK [Toxoplasma gondii RUB]|uniref:non-specific serine/threonine protein kinase n=2 Tax=Toxoplasma gondii TaxID=5811 RepID=A0A086LTV5_TOXGO|nr:putative cell-cycle-associated protein kinase SRPK [Toxoplasma gondii RUB]KFH06553.1 putative cell-cycle-associated protein kinase SRPK [Toxoplasma gondii VAND]